MTIIINVFPTVLPSTAYYPSWYHPMGLQSEERDIKSIHDDVQIIIRGENKHKLLN